MKSKRDKAKSSWWEMRGKSWSRSRRRECNQSEKGDATLEQQSASAFVGGAVGVSGSRWCGVSVVLMVVLGSLWGSKVPGVCLRLFSNCLLYVPRLLLPVGS